MNSQAIPAIDVHGHYGTYHRPALHDEVNRFMSGDSGIVAERGKRVGIELTIVSPLRGLMPRGRSIADVETANDETAELINHVEGLLQYVIIDPRRPKSYEQARAMLRHPRCMGIKIHGEEHQYYLEDHGDTIFAFAAECHAVVLAHSGDHHTMPLDFLAYADRYPEVRLILAHLGHSPEADQDPSHQVRAIQRSRHGNIYTDTSSSASLMPGLIEWAVGEIGPEHILFGTDTPLYHAASQRARIDAADLEDDVKSQILHTNAERLFGVELPSALSRGVSCD